MVSYESKEQLMAVFQEFWARAIKLPVYQKLLESGIIARFDIEDPEATLTIDLRNPGPDGKIGSLSFEPGPEPDITVWSRSEMANRFWQGKLRTSLAMAKGDIKLEGSVMKGLSLIGKIKPLYEVYIGVLKDLDLEQLLV